MAVNTQYQYPRVLKGMLVNDLNRYPVVAVMGARQVGKSTLCRSLADERGFAYCNLDKQGPREMALNEPDRLVRSFGDQGAFIDEAQRAPGLFLAIKATVDQRDRPGQYLLSGSNQPKVRRCW
jgi:predicted AAA+ superfamily ATPase